jgi:uncharacterized membrane protein YqjE
LLEGVRSVLPALLRHAAAYGDLIGADTESAVAAVKRRLVLGVAAFLTAWLAVALAVVWLIAVVWDTPYRLWMIGGLSVALAVSAVIVARAIGRDDEPFRRVRAEWAADRELLRQLSARLTEDRHA